MNSGWHTLLRSLLLLASLCGIVGCSRPATSDAAAMRCPSPEVMRFGRFEVSFPNPMRRSPQVFPCLDEIVANAQEHLRIPAEDEAPIREEDLNNQRTESIGELLRFVERHPEDYAALTALLIACSLSEGAPAEWSDDALKVLNIVKIRYPGTWQAQVVPLLEAVLIFDSQSIQDRTVRLRRIIQCIEPLVAVPDADLRLDDPEVRTFAVIYGRVLDASMHANALLVLANVAWLKGTDPDEPEPAEVERAAFLYRQIVDKHAGTTSAGKASQMLETIRITHQRTSDLQ